MSDTQMRIRAITASRKLSCRGLVSIDDLTREDIDLLFDLADIFWDAVYERKERSFDFLRGKTVCNVFKEGSTRTRVSFEQAAQILGAHVTTITHAGSSMEKKGETLLDTLRNLERLAVDAFVIRQKEEGVTRAVGKAIKTPVISGGDGAFEHPTQALLDWYTLKREFGSVEGKQMLIVGDVAHSRVFGSNAKLAKKLSAKISVAAPEAFVLEHLDGVEYVHDLRAAVKSADCIYTLRIQFERDAGKDLASLDEYKKYFQVNDDVLAHAPSHAVVMHPGPINREVEITSAVADGPRSRILTQVQGGLVIRMALLTLLIS